jgi:hypothetical protein
MTLMFEILDDQKISAPRKERLHSVRFHAIATMRRSRQTADAKRNAALARP